MCPSKIEDENDENEELGLFAGDFKGYCYNYGQQGHKGANCPNRKKGTWKQSASKNNRKKFHGKCDYCGKIGHKKLN